MEHWFDTLSDAMLFVEVARAGSFRHAAQRLGMPVSTLSRRIAALERRLGLPLLLRTTRSVRLAPSARAYFERCQQVLEAARQAQDALAQGRERSERLRISMPVDLGVELLGPLIAAHAARHPGLALEFDHTPQPRDLFRDPVDLVFRIGRTLDDRVVARRIADIAAGLYAAPSLLRRLGAPAQAEALAGLPCLNLRMAQGAMPWKVGGRQWAAAPGSAVIGGNSVALLCRLAEQGHGVALLPRHLGEPAVRARRLVPVLPGQAVAGWPLFALTATRSLPALTRGLLAHLRESLAAMAEVSAASAV